MKGRGNYNIAKTTDKTKECQQQKATTETRL